MLICYGENNSLVLGLIETDLQELRAGKTRNFLGTKFLVKDIIVFYGKDKVDVIAQLRAGGVEVTEAQVAMYEKGERTDNPPKPM